MQPNGYVIDCLHKTFSYAKAYGEITGKNTYGVRACTALKSINKDKKYFDNMESDELFSYCQTF